MSIESDDAVFRRVRTQRDPDDANAHLIEWGGKPLTERTRAELQRIVCEQAAVIERQAQEAQAHTSKGYPRPFRRIAKTRAVAPLPESTELGEPRRK